jgi:predicted O-linked N-acetylglucosamine transferase (SPINDLY family)
VLTRPGALAVQCYATGLYRQMGMDSELVVHDRRQYVAKAVKIGTEPEYREHLVRTLLERDHAVFDDRRVIAEYERFFSSVIDKNVTTDKR